MQHKLNCGTTPTEGLRVFTNDWSWGTIIQVADSNHFAGTDRDRCGTYCEAWHTVRIDADAKYCAGQTKIYNCDRLTTREPR